VHGNAPGLPPKSTPMISPPQDNIISLSFSYPPDFPPKFSFSLKISFDHPTFSFLPQVASIKTRDIRKNYPNLELFLLPAGDSMSMMDKDVLDRATVLWATTVYSVANLNEMLPRDGDYPFTSTSTRVASSTMTLLLTLAAAAVSLLVFRLN